MDHLNIEGLCKRCRATDAINALFPEPVDGTLAGLHRHLLSADPKYVLGLIRGKSAWTVLKAALVVPGTLTHEDLDALGTHRAVAQVRSLLVEHAVLPPRDECAHRLREWTALHIASLPHTTDQLALRHFVGWRQQRLIRPAPMTHTIEANDKRELRLILSLVTHLNTSDRTLRTTEQWLVDQWVLHAPRDAFRVRRFLLWSTRTGTSAPLLPPPSCPGGNSGFNLGGSIGPSNESALRHALSDDTLNPRTRLAIVLTVVYGIRVHRIAALRLEDLSIRDGVPGVHLGSVRLDLPATIAPCISQILAGVPVRRLLGGSTHDTTWVYPSPHHGKHQLPSSLAAHLRRFGVSPMTAHQAATGSIVSQVPPAVVSRILGVSLTTAASWQRLTAANAEYR